VSESTASVRAEDQPSWADVVRRAEHGETVPVIAQGRHVADVVPSGELDRLRETVKVLSDPAVMRDLADTEADVIGVEAIRAMVATRTARKT
jgi:antitoxin (DNA-binding transcriptional repressor) of toxin-antitoxin stability system